MAGEGHDFQRVTLVGVVKCRFFAEPAGFRAAERTFQLLTQVGGARGTRRIEGARADSDILSEHYAIQDAVKQDYSAFFDRELHFRQMMAYPPFTSLANVIVRDTSLEKNDPVVAAAFGIFSSA